MDKDLERLIDNPRFLAILNSLSEYIYIIDADGRMQFMNSAAERFEQITSDKIKGRHIKEIYMQKESPTLMALEKRKAIQEHENIYMMNGKQYRQLAKSIPLFSGDKLIGACTIQRDITFMSQILSDNTSLQKYQQQHTKDKKRTFDALIGDHPDFLKSKKMAEAAALNDAPVLLSGFTGSGKEVFANAIHNASSRKNNPFLAINCAAVPDGLIESILFGTTKGTFTGSLDKSGLFEQAEGGTLFLDEINSMSLNSQAKLLRVLEEKEIRKLGDDKDIKIDVRIISSINTTPNKALENHQLREDLFYRLSVTTIIIPAIRERKGDIELLTQHFIAKYNGIFNKHIQGLARETQEFFLSYSWPGNVRQLKHVVESAVNAAKGDAPEITIEDLPSYLFEDSTKHVETFSDAAQEPSRLAAQSAGYENSDRPNIRNLAPENLYETIKEKEKTEIMEALMRSGGNISKAARDLKMNRQTLVYRMKKYNITR